jgi:hypothetical protein
VNIDAQTHHRGVRLLVVKSKQLFITQPQGINVKRKLKGQSRMENSCKDTGNTGHKTENEDKQNKKHNTEN